MPIVSFKIIAALSILILTVLAGLLPLRLARNYKHLLHFGDAFASGVFLSAALLHLLPESEQAFSHVLGTINYPAAQLICIITFIVLLLMERSVLIYGHCHEPHHQASDNLTTPFLLTLVLTVHSFVEGAAIGISSSFAGAFVIYLAIIAHKGSESFALSTNLHRYNLTLRSITRIILIFSLMTPLGVFAASLTKFFLQTNSGEWLEAIFNAVATGTFLYLGTAHIIEGVKSFERIGELVSLIIGITLMAVVAIWV